MRLWFRVDASAAIGAGHFMRCLAIAECWLDAGTIFVEYLQGTAYLAFYDRDHMAQRQGPYEVHNGEVWVMGDNRTNSADSRRFGVVPIDSIVGRAVARVWPPGRIAFL